MRSDLPIQTEDAIEPERYELSEPLPYRFESSRRTFLRTLGGGLLIALLAAPRRGSAALRATPGAGVASRADALSAWIHIGEDELVRIFVGKTEIGQDIRTTFTQVLLEELDTAAQRVEVVCGDTGQ